MYWAMYAEFIRGGNGREFYILRAFRCATFARAERRQRLSKGRGHCPRSVTVLVVAGERLARYGFPDGHPFGPDRHAAFLGEFATRGLDRRVRMMETRAATRAELRSLSTRPDYLDLVAERSVTGEGYLDAGDTPAWRGVYEAAADVVGATLLASEEIMAGRARRAFVPIAGLHHATRGAAAGFCVFNDCGVAVEMLRRNHGLKRIAYVDIDAHHGDGVFYGFESDPDLIFADIHEDGRYLYPGTGHAEEVGSGAAAGSKLNIPMPPGADDAAFDAVWPRVLAHLRKYQPEFILLQAAPTAWKVTRSPTCVFPPPRMNGPRATWRSWRMSWGMGGSWVPAAVATTGSTSPRRGPASWRGCWVSGAGVGSRGKNGTAPNSPHRGQMGSGLSAESSTFPQPDEA